MQNNYEYTIHKKEKKILDLNELTDKRIIIFTENNIEILKKEQYMISKSYEINNN